MNIRWSLIVSASMLFAVAVAPGDASAENFPGIQAHAKYANQVGCLYNEWSAIKNLGTAGTGTNCNSDVAVLLPTMGETGNQQQWLTANVYIPSSGSPSDVECYWMSNDPTDQYPSGSGWWPAPGTGQQSINLTVWMYDPGSSYLECHLAPNTELNSAVWTM
jgi:hypothetical protein